MTQISSESDFCVLAGECVSGLIDALCHHSLTLVSSPNGSFTDSLITDYHTDISVI